MKHEVDTVFLRRIRAELRVLNGCTPTIAVHDLVRLVRLAAVGARCKATIVNVLGRDTPIRLSDLFLRD